MINGGLVHYEAFGKGKPILLIHGWLGSWRYWYPTMTSLAVDYRVYAIDLWGFGDSDKSERRFTMNHYVALVESFIADLGLVDPVLVGHSLGSAVAIEYAYRSLSPISKIMAVSLPLTVEAVDQRLGNYARNSVLSKVFGWKPTLDKEVEEEANRAADNAIRLSLQSFTEHYSIDKIMNTKSDILIVYGEKDDVIITSPVAQLDHCEHIKTISLPDSRHFPMLDEGHRFNRLLREFADKDATLESLSLNDEWRRRIR